MRRFINTTAIRYLSILTLSQAFLIWALLSFNAGESQKINDALLKQGEVLINQLNERARQDTIRYAQEVVNSAEEKVKEARLNWQNSVFPTVFLT